MGREGRFDFLWWGEGGMDLGFTQAGFEIIFANDISLRACETYKKNLGLYFVYYL